MLLLVVYVYVSSASLIVVRPKADTGRRRRWPKANMHRYSIRYSMDKYSMVMRSSSHQSLLFTTAFEAIIIRTNKINCCIFLEKDRGLRENLVWPIIDVVRTVGVLNSQ